MDINKINRKHFVETDMHYRIGRGLSSKMLKYQNGVVYLEVTVGKKWKKSYTATSSEIAYLWKDTHIELKGAIACKVYIIDLKENLYKKELIHKGIHPGYDAKKGIIYNRYHLN